MISFCVKVGEAGYRFNRGTIRLETARQAQDVASAINNALRNTDSHATAYVSVPLTKGFAHIPLDMAHGLVQTLHEAL